ncbi:MAG: class I SAM-dependent methyltransferase [Halobacteriales archaeon]
MGHHTFDPEKADRLNDAERRYRYVSMEELVCAVDPSTDDTVVDLGSGTGFYTDDVARFAGKVYAVDVQEEMQEMYRKKGVPEKVETVTAEVEGMPFDDSSLDAAFSTMTYHEFASPEALAEVRRVLRPEARLVVADWSANGDGELGPPTDERYDAEEANEALKDAGFAVERADERTETFFIASTVA